MRTHLIALILICASVYANAQQYDTLYNKTIVSLTKVGLPPQTIISKIQTSIVSFDVSVNALLDLQSNGVSGDVINEMIKSNDKANAQAGKEVNSNNPNAMHKPGIYYYNQNNSANALKRVDPTVTATNKSGGLGTALLQHYTYGIAKDKIRSSLSGDKSHLQINEENPVFYFYFKTDENASADSWFFATATSPNEFVLVTLEMEDDSREMVVGDMNAYGSSTGVPNKIKVPFDYTEVSEGIYKVNFKKPLAKGEYCFLYSSTTPSRYNNNKVFDFGIKNKE